MAKAGAAARRSTPKAERLEIADMKKLLMALLAASAFSAAACTAQPEQEAAANNAAAAQPGTVEVAQANLPDADPAMWVVRDEDTTIYLFGTFHLLDGKTDWFNDEVREAFDSSQELVFEIDMPGNPQEIGQRMGPLVLKYAVDPKGRTISSRLSAQENKKLNEAFATMGAPAAAFDRFEPWFITMSLSAVAAQKLGLTGDKGAEEVLRRAAQGRNMKMGAVETLEAQIQMFDSLPEDQQLVQLKETIKDLDSQDDTLPRMLKVWNAGDAAGLEQVMSEGMEKQPGLRRILLENRNKAWAEWIDQRLDQPGVVFMAVGAGHLVGADSVQTFLQKRGIQSARVPQRTPAQ
jgi:uncharacterized protein YbaP (TraB family)